MNKKKVFAAVISLALVIAVVLPGTLAVSSDQDSSESTVSVETLSTPAAEETAKVCTCENPPAEGEAHAEGCELYEAPKTCTCENPPAEGEAHAEGCGFYVAPETPAPFVHIETCSDECKNAECVCACHLFDKIMACETLDDIWALLDAASEETLSTLTDEQNAQIDEKIEALEPPPAPEVVIEESHDETVPSEIVYRTVNYTNVAPFGDPVTGGQG